MRNNWHYYGMPALLATDFVSKTGPLAARSGHSIARGRPRQRKPRFVSWCGLKAPRPLPKAGSVFSWGVLGQQRSLTSPAKWAASSRTAPSDRDAVPGVAVIMASSMSAWRFAGDQSVSGSGRPLSCPGGIYGWHNAHLLMSQLPVKGLRGAGDLGTRTLRPRGSCPFISRYAQPCTETSIRTTARTCAT
jgi:hypothetical protein